MRKEKWDLYLDTLQGHPSVCQTSHTLEKLIFIKELIPPDKFPRLLDVGVGEGLESKLLTDLGYNVVGIIKGEPNIKFAYDHYPQITFVESDMHDFLFPSESFDAVFMNHTFEHSYAPFIFLLELYCILRPNGRVWIGLPSFKEITDPKIGEDSKIGHHHPNIICKNLLTQFFRTTGFKILQYTEGSYLLEKQDISYVHSDVKTAILKRKEIFG